MLIKERLEMYKSMYYYELDLKEKINARISIPLGVITLIVGGGFYFIKGLFSMPSSTLKNIYFILLISYVLSVIVAIITLIYSYYGYEYHYLPKPKKIDNYIKKIKDYYDKNYEDYFYHSNMSKQDLIHDDVNEFLIDKYVDATEHNQKLNFKKLTWQRRATLFIIITIIIGTINLPIYYELNSRLDSEPIKVIVESKSSLYKKQKEVLDMSDSQNPKPKPPPKPTQPPIQKIQESLEQSKVIRKNR